jgi:tRNA(Ile)-lysidine synthase
MKKKKKISDFLIDNKVPLNKKENTFVVVSGDDIVCVLGHRIDNRYRISAFTKKVLTIDYKEK